MTDLLSPEAAAMRVEIAQDVLEQIGSGSGFKPACGWFVHSSVPMSAKKQWSNPGCQACALGSLFLASIQRRIRDSSETGHNMQFEEISPALRKHFTEAQLCLIENAFEQGQGYFSPANNNHDFDLQFHACINKAIAFGKKHGGRRDPSASKARLVAIMENIVANGGWFRP